MGSRRIISGTRCFPTSVTTTNSTIAYSTQPGHSITTADAVKAYVQAHLKSEHPTWIALLPELWPEEWKNRGYRKPMVRLIKALYGHPESGAHWEKHFEEIPRDPKNCFDAVSVEAHPTTYWIPKEKLLLTVYVDDLLLVGPKAAHAAFWDKLRDMVEIEEVAPITRILGRHHEVSRSESGGEVIYDMSDYTKQSVEMYTKLTGVAKFKQATTPFLPDGSFTPSDDDIAGEIAPHACALMMKQL